MDETPGESADLLGELATATRLHEGPEGVRKILRSVYRTGPVPIRALARDLGIPVPVVAAVRGELEKRGLAVRAASGVAMTEAGIGALEASAGITSQARFDTIRLADFPDCAGPLIADFERIASSRPDADVSLDQSHATAETSIRRAMYLFEHDAIEGRSIVFLGDDDLTSVAVGLIAAHLGIQPKAMTVLDVDERLVRFLAKAGLAGYGPDVCLHDLRQPVPDTIRSQMDVFFTDPPYTISGLRLFAGRGASCLRPEVGKLAFISFGRKSPVEGVEIGRTLVDLDLATVEVIPDFNRYDGAQLLGGSSQMIRTVFGGNEILDSSAYEGPLYTRDARQANRG